MENELILKSAAELVKEHEALPCDEKTEAAYREGYRQGFQVAISKFYTLNYAGKLNNTVIELAMRAFTGNELLKWVRGDCSRFVEPPYYDAHDAAKKLIKAGY